MKFWAYFLIPVYTVLFTRGYNWFHQFFCDWQFFWQKAVFFPVGRAGGQLFLYNPQKGQIQAYPESCLWEDGPGGPGAAVLCHHDAVSSWGTSAKISVTYHICILIRITGAFIPAVGHMVPVSDISSCLPEVPIWLAGHCVRVRAASGGSRDHKQRTGDICDTDIGGHGWAADLQDCQAGGPERAGNLLRGLCQAGIVMMSQYCIA